MIWFDNKNNFLNKKQIIDLSLMSEPHYINNKEKNKANKAWLFKLTNKTKLNIEQHCTL